MIVAKTTTPIPKEISVNKSYKLSQFKGWLLALFIVTFSLTANAQVDVSTGGSPTSYTTLKEAFDSINSGAHTGTILISITGNTTETATATLNSSGTGIASYTSILIKPSSGTTATISGAISGALVKFVGADNVTIDGSNNGTTSRNLTFTNTLVGAGNIATATSPTCIWLGGSASNGATNNTIKNCIVAGASTARTYGCIVSSSSTTLNSASPAANTNNTFTNNQLTKANYGIQLLGFASTESGNTINSNSIVDSIFLSAIDITNQTSFNINGNYFSFSNLNNASSSTVHAINVRLLCTNGLIYNNHIAKVYEVVSGFSARGMTLASTATSPNITIYNNFINDIWSTGASNSFINYGMLISSVNGGYKIYNNTIHLITPLGNSSAVSSCLFINGTTLANSIDLRNNILNNAASGGGNSYALACISATSIFSNCDYNTYNSVTPNINVYTASQTSTSSLAAFQALTGKDANSKLLSPSFVSSTDLHLSQSAGNANVNNAGVFIAAVTTDFDGNTRSTNAPDIGADEIVYTPRITGFSPATACPGTTVTINGADFTGTTAVSLAGLSATGVTVISTSQLTAVVASGATSGSNSAITVTNNFGTATSTSNLNRLAAGTFVSKSISTGSVGDQVTLFGTNLSGVSAVSFNGTTASYSVTNATEIIAIVPSGATSGNILFTDACGNSVNAGSFSVVAANPCVAPSSQATNFVVSSSTSSALNGTFTAASGNPSGYVVVYSTSALSSAPVDGQTYTAGAGFGGIIQQVSSSNSIALSGLSGNTAYTVTVYSYNGGGCTGGPLYNTTNPLVYNFTTCSSVPTSVTATPIGNSSGNSIDFSWGTPVGGGANSITYSLEVTTDAAYTTHVAGSPFTTSQLSQSVSGLNFNTVYYYRIRSNNGCFSSYVSSSVTSACGAGNLPFAENFDATLTSALPTCWFGAANNALSDVNSDGITWQSSNIDSRITGMTNPRGLRYVANTVTTSVAANDWAYMPGVVLTGGQSYTLSFLVGTVANAGENLQVYYGTTQTPAIKVNANKIYDEAGLSNRAAVYKTATFTPATTGTYYLGFYTNSPSNAGGGLILFVDDIKLDVTPSAPAAPAPVTTSNATAFSMQVNWTDNSSTEVGYYVYSSTDNVNWVLRNTVANNVSSVVVSNLKANTTYYFKVQGYNAGGIGAAATSSGVTTLTCGSYTTNSYIGTLFTGTGNNWNNAANWSQNRVPNACDDVEMNGALPITTVAYVYLPNPVAIHNLTINQTQTGTALQRLFLWTQDYSFDISGDVTVSNNRTANTTITTDAIYLVSGPGILSIDGNVSIGVTGNRVAALGSGGASLGPIYFKGNVNFGDQAFLNNGTLINYIFDAPVSQTVTVNSLITSATPATYGLGAVTIGYNNSPTVTFTDTMRVNSTLSRVVGDMTINNGSTLIINDSTSLNRTQTGGTFTMGANSVLRLKGATSGVGNSNMPDNFTTYAFNNSSTVIYNGTAAQTIASAPTYGNLTLNNATGATLNGNTVVNNVLNFTAGKISTGSNTLTLGLSGSVTGAGTNSYVNGTLEKTKIADMSGALNFEIGDDVQYAPVFVGFNGPSNSGGTFSAKTTSGTPAALGYTRSGISATNYLARTYRLANNGITGISSVYTNFNYASSDIVGNPSNSSYQIADSVYGGGWSLVSTMNPNGTSSNGTNTVLATTATADFLIGEIDPAPAPDLTGFTPTSACEGSSYVITGSNFYAITGVKIGGTTVPSFVVNSPTQITITVPVGIGNGFISVSNATGTATTLGSFTTFDQPQTTVSNSSQTICSGDAITTIVVGNSSNIGGTTYSWTRTGNNIAGGTNGASGTSDISGTLISSSTIPETITYTVTSDANGCTGTTAIATVVVKASPGVVNLTPSSSAICQTSVQQLVANYTAATGSSTKNSGPVSLTIPDNLATGINTTLNVTDVPTGAVVTRVDVGFSINHTYVGDLAVNVTAPNGKTLNLAYQAGAEGDDYVNTVISSSSFDQIPIDSTPGGITGTFGPDGFNNVGTTAYRSNTTDFNDLFATANGTWRFSARDYFAGDTGSITNWYVKIYYTLSPTFTWAPTAGLFSDPGGFTALSGNHPQTVYAKNVPGNYSYSATLSFNGCTVNSTAATVDIEAVPIATRTPASQTVCSGNAINSILVASSNDPSATLSWSRDHTSDISGIASSGTGDITGTLINETSSPITVTFTITPIGTGSQACAGASVISTVTVNPTPIATATPLSQNSCSGSAITPLILGTTNVVSGTTFAWTRDNNSEATGIAASGVSFPSGILTNTAGTTTVTFSISAVSPNGCSGTPATATVSVYNNSTAYTVTGGGTFCSPGAGLPVGLTNSQVGYNYQLLLDGAPAGSPVAGTGSALNFGNQVQSGVYTVIASNAGCTKPMIGSASITANNSVTPTISVITSNTTICANTNATFFAIATNTGANATYDFMVNGISKQNTTSKVFITNTLLNNDVVTCTLASTNTCQTASSTESNPIQMTVTSSSSLAAPAAITGLTTQCTLGAVSYVGSVTTGGTWSSSDPSVASIVPVNGKITAMSNGTAIISYTISSSNGCTNSASVVFTVAQQSAPGTITGGSSSFCVGTTTTFTNSSTTGVWSIPYGRATINSSTGLATGTSAGGSAVRYTITNAAGCSSFVERPITVNAKPAVPLIAYAPGTPLTGPNSIFFGGAASTFCKNAKFSLVGTPTGGHWSYSQSASIATVTDSLVSPNNWWGNVVINGQGSGNVIYTVTNANGCTNSRAIAGNGTTACVRARGVELASDYKPETDFTLYPNPAKGSVAFNAELVEAGGKIVVTDMFGKTVKAQALSLGTNTINISTLSKGFYLVSVITNDGKKTKKLVVE